MPHIDEIVRLKQLNAEMCLALRDCRMLLMVNGGIAPESTMARINAAIAKAKAEGRVK
jgi:hypothetical protein